MTDLHTHILPGMDDGAPDAKSSIELLKVQVEQGVDTVALTSHFYPWRESVKQFLDRRQAAFSTLEAAITQLPTAEAKRLPKLVLGAEVAWIPALWELPDIKELCYAGTELLLVELPLIPWNKDLIYHLYKLQGSCGVSPVLAHLDRYIGLQDESMFEQIIQMGIPFQISANALLQRFSGKAWKLWWAGGVLISDCHDLERRPPNLAEAMQKIERRKGKELARVSKMATQIL